MSSSVREIKGNFETVDLSHLDPGHAIKFTQAEVSTKCRSPLVLIRYSVDGELQELGLRLDLDKGIFLDLPCINLEQAKAAQNFAPTLASYIGTELFRRIKAQDEIVSCW
jgi:hypothetical protein